MNKPVIHVTPAEQLDSHVKLSEGHYDFGLGIGDGVVILRMGEKELFIQSEQAREIGRHIQKAADLADRFNRGERLTEAELRNPMGE